MNANAKRLEAIDSAVSYFQNKKEEMLSDDWHFMRYLISAAELGRASLEGSDDFQYYSKVNLLDAMIHIDSGTWDDPIRDHKE